MDVQTDRHTHTHRQTDTDTKDIQEHINRLDGFFIQLHS